MQVATPEDLYRKPVNEFVAQFLGSSTRLGGIVTEVVSDGRYVIKLPGSGIECECAGATGMGEGDHIVAVIRPESIHVHAAGATEAEKDMVGLNTAVDSVTFMGSHYRTIFRNDESTILVHIPSNAAPVKAGDNLHASWNVRDMWAAPAEKEV